MGKGMGWGVGLYQILLRNCGCWKQMENFNGSVLISQQVFYRMSLDQDTANQRKDLIRSGSISYNYNIIITPTKYYGLAEMNFYIQNLNFTQLKIDFKGREVEQIIVNSVKVDPQTTENFIIFTKQFLQKGRNKISIMYANEYDNDRTGCISFYDKDQQYIYTDFEPYGAHRVFPCFDQPNLKATMKLAIVTPSDWIAVSNQPEITAQKFNAQKFRQHTKFNHTASNELLDSFLQRAGQDTKMTLFDYTEQISTYVFAFAAGPYLWIDADQAPGEVPMRALCISSSILMLDSYSSFIFDVTKKAMKFYENFFGQPYPFQKYDMIWVREYQSYAMENAGLVTFSQEKTLKTYATEDDYYDLADTLTHELAHHWFGNLVTMDWWDDLWLNESFADFISQFTLGKINSSLIHQLKPSAMYFRDRKSWGYTEDERNSATHAIRGAVLNTDVAASIFDGITYAKGAAAMKQFMFLVGQDNFSLGLQAYFEQYKWSNATIDEFLEAFRKYFPSSTITIDDWKNTWLQTPSLNVFESIWDPSDQAATATLRLYQSAFTSDYPTLRSHQIEVAFFDVNANIVDTKTVLIAPGATLTTVTYDGSKKVKAILVNYNDQSFLENYIDPQSLQFFMQNILLVSDDLTRALIWYNIAQMNKQTLMRLDQYVGFIVKNLFQETMTFVVNQILSELLTFLKNYTSTDEMIALASIVFAAIYDNLKISSDVDLTTVLTRQFINYAQSDSDILKLKDFLLGADPSLADIEITDEDLPWEIVKKVFSVSDSVLSKAGKEAVFAFVQQTDNSQRTRDARVVCDAILLNTEADIAALYRKFTQGEVDLTNRYLLAEGWRSKYHQDLVKPYAQNYFNDLERLSTELSYAFFEFFYTELRPLDTNYASQVSQYTPIRDQFRADPELEAHAVNLSKIIDDLTLNISNVAFNTDSNLTLTQQRAIDRFSYVNKDTIYYISHIGFVPLDSSTEYSGMTEMSFELKSIPKLLPVDFVSKNVTDLVVNGFNVTPILQGEFLLIPRIYLQLGQNSIAVNYINSFNNDGLGCLSFIDISGKDPADYIYTQFQPYSAHRLIPCFDQPDLKAKVFFNIILPEPWVAVSNQIVNYNNTFSLTDYIDHAPYQDQKLLVSKYLNGKVGNFYVFNPTEKISTYLYCLAVGNYYSVQLPVANRYNNIPMSIYSLASYKDALDRNADFIFEITKLSVQFFEGKFNVAYPFSKYDTVFCHEFSAGAMENPGIITFNDTYLYQQVVSVEKMVQLGVVIAHECAHNWFGDYVTMKWWDDLWLNQSFADFMAYFCIDGIKNKVTTIPQYTSGWIGGVARVVGGYREDQLSTTHPIRSAVPNTSLATVYFDNITYRKGLATLKQLMFLMGEANFFKGVNNYFNTRIWSNGTIDDFLGSMSIQFTNPAPTYNLDLWKQDWLLTPSLNIVEVDWDPASTSTTATLTITQTAFTENYPKLRFHMVNIAFFKADGSYTTQKVLINNVATTKVTYNASVGVKAILINQGLQAFVKYRMDDTSLLFFQQNINQINKGLPENDALTRNIIWFYMNEMVRDGKLKLLPYRDVILSNIPDEPEDGIYSFELQFLNESTGSYIPSSIRKDARMVIFDFIIEQLKGFNTLKKEGPKRKPVYLSRVPRQNYPSQIFKIFQKSKCCEVNDQVNRIKILQDYLPVFCSNDAQIDSLNQWRLGTNPDLTNYPITLSQAWAVVKLVYTSGNFNASEKTAIYDDQNRKTPGLTAQLAQNTVLALAADTGQFDVIYQSFRESFLSLTAKASWSEGWNHPIHKAILADPYKALYFQDIPFLSKQLPNKHFEFFYTNLQPIDDDLSTTIAQFEAINLVGSDMIGHMNNIRKITDIYKLRASLYLANSLIEK